MHGVGISLIWLLAQQRATLDAIDPWTGQPVDLPPSAALTIDSHDPWSGELVEAKPTHTLRWIATDPWTR